MDLSGRVAVVTGAGQGLGASIAETLGAAGAAVAATDINGSRAEATAEALRAPGMTHYCASKFGVVGMTQALARELAAGNITVNALCPRIVRSSMWDAELVEIAEARQCTMDEAWEFALSATPLGRPQEPRDIGTRSRSWPRMSRRTSPGQPSTSMAGTTCTEAAACHSQRS